MALGRRWRLVALLLGVGLLPVLLLLVVVHLPPVQRWAFARGAAVLAAKSGFRVTADRAALRLWPARLEAAGLEVSASDRPLLEAERLVARWRWSALLGQTPRIAALEVDGLVVDLRQLPTLPARAEGPPKGDPYRLLELGRLELRGGRLAADAAGVDLSASGIRVSGGLEDGTARLDLSATVLAARRDERELSLGPLELTARADSSGVTVERCRLEGEAARLDLAGVITIAEAGGVVNGKVDADLDLQLLALWWDPALAARLQPRGRLALAGTVEIAPGRRPVVGLVHRGAPFSVAGYTFERLDLRSDRGAEVLEVAGSGWGSLRATLTADNVLRLETTLDAAPLGPALALAPVVLPPNLPQPLSLSGTAQALVRFPVDLDRLEATADLTLTAPDAVARLRGDWAVRRASLERFEVEAPGGRLSAAGTVSLDGVVGLRGELAVAEPARLLEAVARFLPEPLPVELGGGPIAGELELTGQLRDPSVRASLRWERPLVAGYAAAEVNASLAGTLDRLDWQAEVEAADGARLGATGVAEVRRQRAEGAWAVEVPDLGALLALARAAPGVDLAGAVAGGGGFTWDSGSFAGSAALSGRRLAWGDWCLDEVHLALDASPERLTVSSLEARAGAARLSGSGAVGLAGYDAPLKARLELEDLDLGSLPLELPELAAGALSARLEVAGTLARPAATLDLSWAPVATGGPLAATRLHGALADGVVRVVSEGLNTAAGPLALAATLPLGSLPRPPWLWPDAPGGPLRLRLDGTRLRSGPLLATLGQDAGQVSVTTDLHLDVGWDLADPAARVVLLELAGVEVDNGVEQLQAADTIRVNLLGSRLEVEPFALAGPTSRIEVAATTVDFAAGHLDAHADVTLDPALARLLPIPIQARGLIRVAVDLSGPLARPSGTLLVDHSGGRLVMRDPPVEVTDLKLQASVDAGVVTVESGEAGLNRGRLDIGGGWDPASGQGLVLQLRGVTFVVAGGLVSRWSGVVAVEPEPGHLARVTGELVLDGGIWDQPVDLAATVLSPSTAPVATDDPTQDILLDLQVRGRGIVKVDNNLGRFDVSWNVVQVRGTVARPVLEGEVRIAAGGEVALTGTPIKLRRGTIEFSGEPGAEPRVELVPEEGVTETAGEGFDATLMAKKGLASGLGKVLGLENETLQPAEIAVETETDPGTRFTVGQRLSRQIALFVSADLSDPQDRSTTLQLWNLRGLPGLALQVFNESVGQQGAAAIERWRWGGTEATAERPVIHKVKLAGDWPISKRTLRRAAGIDRGEAYEPIFLFVAGVRMERALASAGYYDARVEGEEKGDEHLPTLVFHCEPGPRQVVHFTGDRVSRAARKEVTALYQPAPLEGEAREIMGATLARRLAAGGYPNAVISVTRHGEELVVDVERGDKVRLEGPVVEGVPPEVAADLALAFGGPAQLAELVRDPQAGARWVERLVRGHGFRDARLDRVWTEPAKGNKGEVHLAVDLGSRSSVSAVRLVGSDPLGLLSAPELGVAVGMPLDRGTIDVAVSRLRRTYLAEGYFGVEARWRIEEPALGRFEVVVTLAPGAQRTVERITFTGLRHLSEPLLRRTFPVREGELLDANELDTGVSNLAAFAPVERVVASGNSTSGHGTEIEVQVTEKPRWTVGLGARWGTDSGTEVLVDLRDDNLLHRGLSANLRAHWGGERKYLAVITSWPPAPGRKLSYGLNLSYDDEILDEWQEEIRSRVTLDAAYGLGSDSSARGYFALTRTRNIDNSQFIPQDQTTDLATLGSQYLLDQRDDPFDPRKGVAFTVDLSWSTELGTGNSEFVRSLVGGALTLSPSRSWTWSQGLRLGASHPLSGVLPAIREARFYAGGQTSIRGFPLDAVGPADFDGTAMGGGALVILNEELRITVWKGLRAAFFADSGNVWESWSTVDLGQVAVGAGLGLRWATPVGPVYADAAWPVVDPAEQGRGVQYYVGIGRPF